MIVSKGKICNGKLAVHPVRSGLVFCCSGGEGEANLFMSSDYGNTWKSLQADLPRGGKGTMVVSPHDNTLIFNGGFGMWKRNLPE